MALVLDGTNGVNASTGSLTLQTGGTTGLTVSSSQIVSFTNPLAGSTGASLVLIQSQTASSSATLDFTTGIDSTYDKYMFTLTNVVPQNSDGTLTLRVSENAGSTWKSSGTDYGYASANALMVTTVTTLSGSFNNADSSIWISTNCGNTSGYGGFSGDIFFYGPSSSTQKKTFTWLGQARRDASGGQGNFHVGAAQYIGSTNAITGIRFLFDTGNIASGTIALYGVKKS
jgi:hypothetical protein